MAPTYLNPAIFMGLPPVKSQRLLWPRTLGHLCPSSVLVSVPCTFL